MLLMTNLKIIIGFEKSNFIQKVVALI